MTLDVPKLRRHLNLVRLSTEQAVERMESGRKHLTRDYALAARIHAETLVYKVSPEPTHAALAAQVLACAEVADLLLVLVGDDPSLEPRLHPMLANILELMFSGVISLSTPSAEVIKPIPKRLRQRRNDDGVD